MNDDGLSIFLSYAREDAAAVEQLYDKLQAAGMRPWMDRRDLLPGQVWDRYIWRAITQATVILVCLSSSSVRKRGYVQREIKKALDLWQEKLEDDIFLVPVRLDDCSLPDALSRFQCLDLFCDEGFSRLIAALRRTATEHSQPEINIGGLRYTIKRIEESDRDRSSYEMAVEFPEFLHSAGSELDQINMRLAGFAVEMLFDSRRTSLTRMTLDGEREASAAKEWWRDELRAYVSVHMGTDSLISVEFSIMTYGAGAAHPNTHTRTFTFLREPLVELQLSDLFSTTPEGYLPIISEYCVSALEKSRNIGQNLSESVEDSWVRDGAGPKAEHFTKWVLVPGFIKVIFDPYAVGSYAEGRQEVDVPLILFNGMLDGHVQRALAE